jgi:hypothetical protein
MRSQPLNDWPSFDAIVCRILDDFEKRRAQAEGYMSHPLFRGQSDARWTLRTTLERFSPRHWTISDYYSLIRVARRAVGSLTGKVWELPEDASRYFRVGEDSIGPPPAYEFMIYLRHHGFPSPLLGLDQVTLRCRLFRVRMSSA